jgi:hypothetical protein
MSEMTPSEIKAKAKDIFSFILVFCPEFPTGTNTNIAREFDQLTELVGAALQKLKSEDAKQWLKICIQELRNSRTHYEKGDRKMGMDMIQRAQEHFENAFSRTPSTARFVAGESGPVADKDSGFPA